MSNFITFIKYQKEKNTKQSTESNSSTLYLLDDSFQSNILEYIPKDFTITTNNGSYKFNIDILNNTSSVISDLNQNNPQDLQYRLDINDAQNVLGKFEQMYQGKIIHFERSDLDVAYKIVDLLNINCISLDDSSFQISNESLINFLEHASLETFTIQTNKQSYKCNLFGIYSSSIIRDYLNKNPTKKEFKFDYEDENAEFQMICDIFNFEKVTITSDNMKSLKKICDHLCIENISEKINRFNQKYEKLYETIDKHQKTIDSIDTLFNLLCQINEKNVQFVSDSIIQSFWVKTEENVQELSAFIIQVANTDISLQPYLIDLIIQLDKESNETNKVKILIPFIVKKSKFNNCIKRIKRSVFSCSFLYYLSKKGIISKEELLNELRIFFKNLHINSLYSNPYQNYDDDDRKQDFIEKKFASNFVHSIYLWFLPEIIEINQFDASHIKSDKVNKFINSFYPDNLDQYKKIRDNVKPNDALTNALRNDDVDTLQLILLNGINPKSNPVVPFNMFEFFVPNGETNYLNYSAAYGSIKCFKHLLSNHFECDLSTFSFAVLGGNKEIIKIVDEKSDELNSLPRKYADDQNLSISYYYAVNESSNRESNFYKIAPSIVKHQNDIFDWILNNKFSSDELNIDFICQLLGISTFTGNIHSFIEIIKKHLTLPNVFVDGTLSTLCSQGFYHFTKIYYILLNKENGYQYHFNDLSSVYFGNLSIFKLCLNGEKTEKMLFSAFKLAVKYSNQNIIEYFFDKLVNEGLNFNLEIINQSLEMAIKEPSGEIFIYLFNKFEKLLNSKIPFNTNMLNIVCENNNLKAAKLIFESYFSSKEFEEKDVTDYFIIAANNDSFDICKYLFENHFTIDFSELSKSYSKFTSINEKIFSLMIDNCDPFIKQQFLYFYFEPAIKNKKYDFVDFLLKQNIITDSAIFIAIENEDLKMIELILQYKRNPSFSINKIYQESTALCKAVKSKNTEIIKTLFSVPTIDPNLCDSEQQTPLMIAFPNIEIMNIILDFIGDDIVHQAKQLLFLKMQTYIMFDLDKEKATRLFEIVSKIKGIEINSADINFLIYACRDNNMKIFNMLINLDNIDLNVCDIYNNTPLTTAISNNNINIAELLIKDQRTDINKNNKDNESPLSLAVSNDQEKIVDLLLNHDKFDPIESHLDKVFTSSQFNYQLKILNSKHFDINHMFICDDASKFYSYPFDDFKNVLKYAVNKNDQKLIDLIIQHPEFDKTKSHVESIIFQIINEYNRFETFKKLLNLLTNEINDYKYQNKSLFDYSFIKWNIKSLKEIINHPNFDFKKNNIQDCFYSCFEVINEQSIEMMKFLYEFDSQHEKLIDLNQLTKSGETIFTLIKNANYGEINEVVNFLLENGADPNIPNKEGKYPLQHAIQIQSFEFVHELLKTEKVDVTKRIESMNNATYLHLAALARETSIFIEILKLDKIDINATDDNGETPLIYIARFSRPKNLKPLFLSEKLDYLHCNNQNKNAIQIAIGNNTDHLNHLNESKLTDKFIFYQELVDEIGNNNFENLKNAQNYIPYLYNNDDEIKAIITQLPRNENEDKRISDFVDNSNIFDSDDFDSKNLSDVIKSSEKILIVKSNSDKEQIKQESLPKLQVKQKSDDHHLDDSQANKSNEIEQINQEKLPKLNVNKSASDYHASESQEKPKIGSKTNDDKNENSELSNQHDAGKNDQSPNSNEVFQIKEPSKPNSKSEKISVKNTEINSSPRSLHNQLKTLINKAEKGDAESQYSLGTRYAKGKGVPVDIEKAFNLYLSAAELGNMNAQYSAASCYSYGKGTEINKEKAFEFYLKSAEQGFDKAQFAVAHFYQYGLGGVKKNHEKAIEWYQKAANQGHKGSIEALDLQ